MNVPESDQIREPFAPDRSMFTPRETEAALDKYIIGQNRAKRAVAIALRNRWRRQQVAPPLRDEIAPKNIIMIGPTGVGKTEIARRLAMLAQSPFIKVEASKFTEVGYVGRDVESMIRDLVEIAVNMVRREEESRHEEKAAQLAEERLLDLLLPRHESHVRPESSAAPQLSLSGPAGMTDAVQDTERSGQSTREKLRRMLHDGRLDERLIELDLPRQPAMPMVEVFSSAGLEEMQSSIRDSFSRMFSKQEKKRRVKVPEALKLLAQEEMEKLIDMDAVTRNAIMRTEESGIVFIDEIDKIASKGGGGGSSPDVSREGVQRDLLPIVEGATVSTKYGMVRTDHILFVASGAFHLSKPSDLVPELQGRFPVRVELDPLGEEEFYRILVEPENALVRQYVALLATESIDLHFTDDGIREVARMAAEVNRATEDIGARRLHTIMERVVDKISYEAPDMGPRTVTINSAYVTKELADIVKDEDLSRFVL